MLNHKGILTHTTKGNVALRYSEKLGRLINYKELVAFHKKSSSHPKLTIVANFLFIESSKVCEVPYALKQFEKLFNNEKRSDFVLVSSDGLEIPVHKIILSTRSLVFEKMMEGNFKEKKENKALIKDMSGKALMEFLRFVYCGRVGYIDDIDGELLNAASEYDLPDLKPICVNSLASKLSAENVLETMMLAELHGETQLKRLCIDFVKW